MLIIIFTYGVLENKSRHDVTVRRKTVEGGETESLVGDPIHQLHLVITSQVERLLNRPKEYQRSGLKNK